MTVASAAEYCANHPDRETRLRCNNCGKPICTSCAKRTPVGYRCPECVKGQQSAFETANAVDMVVVGVVAAVSGAIATLLLGLIGFWGLLAAPFAGGLIAEAIRRGLRGRRSRRMPTVAAVGVVVGSLLLVMVRIAPLILYLLSGGPVERGALTGFGLGLLFPLAYGAIMAGTVYSRLGGIRL